jgi:hypothetical protein
MIFVFANLVSDAIEQLYKFPCEAGIGTRTASASSLVRRKFYG